MKIYVNGLRELNANDISFDEDIEFSEDDTGCTILSFYWAVWFNPLEVFDIVLDSLDDGCWINIYANFNAAKLCVVDELEIIINHYEDITEKLYYQLNEAEMALIYNAMEVYCMDCTKQTLKTFIEKESSSVIN